MKIRPRCMPLVLRSLWSEKTRTKPRLHSSASSSLERRVVGNCIITKTASTCYYKDCTPKANRMQANSILNTQIALSKVSLIILMKLTSRLMVLSTPPNISKIWGKTGTINLLARKSSMVITTHFYLRCHLLLATGDTVEIKYTNRNSNGHNNRCIENRGQYKNTVNNDSNFYSALLLDKLVLDHWYQWDNILFIIHVFCAPEKNWNMSGLTPQIVYPWVALLYLY